MSETKDVNPEDFGTKAEVTFNSEKLLLRKLDGSSSDNFQITDLNSGVETGYLKFRGNKYALESDSSMIPDIGELVYHKDEKEIAGFKCKKVTASMGEGEMEIWLTNDLGVDWCPLKKVNGFALEYSLPMPYGKLKYTASEVKIESISPEFFKISEGYRKVTLEELQAELMGGPTEEAFKKGETLRNFAWTDLEGNTIELESLKGKVVLINFWFINCPPCRMEMPDLNELKQEYAGKEVEFVAITFDPKERVEAFLEDNQFDFQIIPDERKTIEAYEIMGFPTSVVLDKNGRVVNSKMGGSMRIKEELAAFIEEAFSQN